ncbi:MAG: hypothetical protein INQ03_02560 [Candidatus Heimdallarchaeota archaeon]|nr:hypothetical protein [Candidatus Heimdallarchaeota archaeon]
MTEDESSSTAGLQRVFYECAVCNQTINFTMEKAVHLERQELKINGLASYIDKHADKAGNDHGVKLFIDPNFHVRTNHELKIEEKKKSAIPMPGLKVTEISSNYPWKTWARLDLELKSEKVKFALNLDREASEKDHTISSKIQTQSTLGLVECSVDAIVHENASVTFQYISLWMQSLCNSLELAASIHIDLVPEVLRYIDTHTYREITPADKKIIAILIDKASILYPKRDTIEMLQKYGPGLTLIELSSAQFTKIAIKLSEFDKFTMRDIQDILKDEMIENAVLEEEVIILALFYLLSMDAFDYKLSYLHQNFD